VTTRAVLRALLLVVVTLLVQETIVLDLTVRGVHPDIMILLPVAAGIVAGPEEGALMGFVAGMAADLLLPTPFGLTALVGCLVGFAVGATTGSITREVWWFPAVVALAASVAWVMLYAVLGAVLGQGQFVQVDLVAVVLVVAVVNAILAAPAVRVTAWALGPSSGDQARSRTARSRW
jgi:rod shape-determining protein MreD